MIKLNYTKLKIYWSKWGQRRGEDLTFSITSKELATSSSSGEKKREVRRISYSFGSLQTAKSAWPR